MAVETVEVELPLKFWLDHKARDCSPSAVELKRNKIYITVKLDKIAFDDIYSDAVYYGRFYKPDREFEQDIIALMPSALATIRRLDTTAFNPVKYRVGV